MRRMLLIAALLLTTACTTRENMRSVQLHCINSDGDATLSEINDKLVLTCTMHLPKEERLDE